MTPLLVILVTIYDVGILNGMSSFVHLYSMPGACLDTIIAVEEQVLCFQLLLLGSLCVQPFDERRFLALLFFGRTSCLSRMLDGVRF